jgi:anionic cell wall polymer biosynthesis LytR-Cps2A-Psr (LCP) family protein
MSKRIDYNNDNNIAPADSAVIVPEAAPNAAPAAAKSSKLANGVKTLAIILIVIAACSIALLIGNLILDSYVSRINQPHYEDAVIEIAPEITSTNAYDPYLLNLEKFQPIYMDVLLNYAEASHSIKSDEKIYNFAIYGINTFASNEKGLATFIMVASFNKETKKVTYATFKENVLVYIPMVGVGELQDAYEWGGSALLSKTIKHNYGIDLNGYIEVDMSVASNLIDNAGGLEISGVSQSNVNGAIERFNERFGTDVQYPNVSNGKTTLNGLQAIAYLRADYEDSNIVSKLLGDVVFKSGLKGIKAGVNIVLDGTKTSILKDDFVELSEMAVLILKNAESSSINVGDGTYTVFWYANSSVYYCDMVVERAALVNALYGTPAAE